MKINNIEEKWKKNFEEAADKNKEDYEISNWSKRGLKNYLKYFFEYFKSHIKKNNSDILLLDLGCGPGAFSRALADKGFNVFGLDYSDKVIAIARERTKGEKINYSVGDIYNLPFESDYFDIVVCNGVFQTLNDPEKALKQIKRVLKKDGLFIITTLNCFSIYFLVGKRNPDLILYNPYKFKDLLKKNDFSAIKIKGIYIYLPLAFISDFLFKIKVHKFLNIFFPFFIFLSHSFYIEGRKKI